MSELDNIINPTIDKVLKPYINKEYNKFITNLPPGINVGSQLPPPGFTINNVNYMIVPTEDQFYENQKKIVLDTIWNSDYPIKISIPLYLFRYLFNFSYILSFIGAIGYCLFTILNINISDIILNKTFIFLFNILLILSGFAAMILWMYTSTINDYINEAIQKKLV
jgi:hypothetical protein